MPLVDIDRRPRRLVRAGVIRLGHKEERHSQSGRTFTIPVPDDHFVLDDAPELVSVYGPEPTELHVYLPFPDIRRNFDGWYQVWAGGTLCCKGDGQTVQYAAPFTVHPGNNRLTVRRADGDTLVNDGVAAKAFAWNGSTFDVGDLVPCPGAAKTMYPQCAACRQSSILKVLMADPALFRLAYYQVATTSVRNYQTLLGTLELVSGNGSRPLTGIPFTLRLVKESITYIEGGLRKSGEKWFLQLEPEAALMRELLQKQVQLLVAATGVPALAAPTDAEIEAEVEYDEVEPEAAPPIAHAAEDEAEEETEHPPTPAQTEPEPLPIRPYPPAIVADRFRAEEARLLTKYPQTNIAVSKDRRTTLVIALAAAVKDEDDKAAAVDAKRHSVLAYLTGKESSNDITEAQARAMLTWLQTDAVAARSEAHAIIDAWNEQQGQQALPMSDDPGQEFDQFMAGQDQE